MAKFLITYSGGSQPESMSEEKRAQVMKARQPHGRIEGDRARRRRQ